MNLRDRWWLPSLLTAAIMGAFYDWTGRDADALPFLAAALVIASMYRKEQTP